MAAPTVPESPAFALKNRVRVERKIEEVETLDITYNMLRHVQAIFHLLK